MSHGLGGEMGGWTDRKWLTSEHLCLQ